MLRSGSVVYSFIWEISQQLVNFVKKVALIKSVSWSKSIIIPQTSWWAEWSAFCWFIWVCSLFSWFMWLIYHSWRGLHRITIFCFYRSFGGILVIFSFAYLSHGLCSRPSLRYQIVCLAINRWASFHCIKYQNFS